MHCSTDLTFDNTDKTLIKNEKAYAFMLCFYLTLILILVFKLMYVTKSGKKIEFTLWWCKPVTTFECVFSLNIWADQKSNPFQSREAFTWSYNNSVAVFFHMGSPSSSRWGCVGGDSPAHADTANSECSS